MSILPPGLWFRNNRHILSGVRAWAIVNTFGLYHVGCDTYLYKIINESPDYAFLYHIIFSADGKPHIWETFERLLSADNVMSVSSATHCRRQIRVYIGTPNTNRRRFI